MAVSVSIQRLSLAFVSCYIAAGCSFLPGTKTTGDEVNPPEQVTEDTADITSDAATTPESQPESAQPKPTSPAANEVGSSPQQNFFREAVNRAQSAVSIGQSAQSPDDWTLAENRWKQAASLMQQVPESDPNYAIAQQKMQEYQQNASQSAQQAAGTITPTQTREPTTTQSDGLVARIPIIDRLGGIPVVPVTLVGNRGTQETSMLFDTGASGTLITQAMAQAVGVVVVGTATVTVADGRQVQVPIGYLDTLQVGGLVVRDLVVGIGGDVGLLGQDVYGQYGYSVGGRSINLYE